MSVKHATILSLGVAAGPALAQDCPLTSDEALLVDLIEASPLGSIADLLGPADVIVPSPNGTELHTWIDGQTSSAVVITVNQGQVVDVSFTPSWFVSDDAVALTSINDASDK